MDMGGGHGTPRRVTGYDSLTVAVVARMVGVAPSTLRTWARRYGLEPSGHRSGLHRRYSESDVARLRYMRALTQSGMSSRDAARRAMEATTDELAATPDLGRRVDGDAAVATGPDLSPLRPGARERGVAGDVSGPVKTLLSTLGNGDAQGSTALVRLALRDLGAARTWDERVLPARTALWRLSPELQSRAEALLTSATVGAVGEVRLPRGARNRVPVHVVSLPGHDDPAARSLLVAALTERSIEVTLSSLGAGAASAQRALAGGLRGVAVVHVAEDPVADQLAGRLRYLGGPVEQVHWGEGWVQRPGQGGGMAELVRLVESATCPPAA